MPVRIEMVQNYKEWGCSEEDRGRVGEELNDAHCELLLFIGLYYAVVD